MSWVAAPTNELLLHFKDDNGKHSTMRMNVATSETNPSGGGAATISAAAQAITDSALYETELLIVAIWNAAVTPTTGPYDRPADKVQFKIKADDGSHVTLNVGAPIAAIFSDAWNVNFGNSLVIALMTALFAHANTAGGASFAAATQGVRRRPPRRKGQ
jgi:hypothetical protein